MLSGAVASSETPHGAGSSPKVPAVSSPEILKPPAPESTSRSNPPVTAPKRWERRYRALLRRYVIPDFLPDEQDGSLVYREKVEPTHSTSNHVRILERERNPANRFLTRAYFRPWFPLHPGGRFVRFGATVDVADRLRSAGIRTPKILKRYQGVYLRRWLQYLILVEEFIPGCEADWSNPEHIRLAFSTLARMHNMRFDRWTRPGESDSGVPSQFSRGFIRKNLERRLEAVRPILGMGFCEALIERIVSESEALMPLLGPNSFSQVHGDYKNSNMLVTPEGELVLIDFLHACQSLAVLEFLDVLVHANWQSGNAQLAAACYFENLDPEIVAHFRPAWKLAVLYRSAYRFRMRHDLKGRGPGGSVAHLDDYLGTIDFDRSARDWQATVRMIHRCEAFVPGGVDPPEARQG